MLKPLLFVVLSQAVLLWLPGCVPTETGNPPLTPPETGISDPVIDTATGTTSCNDEGSTCGDEVRIISGNLTVDVKNAEIWLFNLDAPSEPYIFPVSSTGAFRLLVRDASPSDLYRLQLRDGNTFYRPRNLRFATNSFAYVEHPLSECLVFAHTHRWSTNGTAGVEVSNQCDDDLPVLSAVSWSGASSVEPFSETIAAGQTARFVLHTEASDEDLLLLRTGEGLNQRLAVNLVP